MLYFPFLIFERYLNFNIIFLINLIIFYFELKEIYKKKGKRNILKEGDKNIKLEYKF